MKDLFFIQLLPNCQTDIFHLTKIRLIFISGALENICGNIYL